MPPLRILHVVHSLDAGGMENGVVNVSGALSAAGFEMHVCCLARGGRFVERFPDRARVHILDKPEGFSLATVAALSRLIRQLSPDVIHTHNFGPLIYAALAGGHSILHGEHGELTPSELAPHRRLLRRFLYRRTARIHTVSHSLRECLFRHGFPAAKIDVVVNGVDTASFQPGPKTDARREAGLPADALLLGLIGRFGPYKRHVALIDAFDQLAPAHPTIALLFVGAGGPLEEATRRRATTSAFASRIHFAGFQADPRVWYRAIDLLVIPSTNEGLSNALLEAMACGIPALCHTACGNQDVIQEAVNGFLRDLTTPQQLLNTLAAVLADPASLAALGRAARLTVESRFTFTAMVAGYERLYSQVAAHRA